jgi:hypothetical protein
MIKHHDPEVETIIDNHPPRFGKVRWAFVRGLLWALNRAEGRFNRIREWALQEAVDCSPDFITFESWVRNHYAERGMKANVVLHEAVVPPVVPEQTHVFDSKYLQ